MRVECEINEERYTRDVEPRLLLVDFLRDYLNLTGTHIGCDTGHCGACTIIMNGRSLKSCMVLTVQVEGARITTIEGLTKNTSVFNSIHRAFSENHALQCGYCTPGIIMSTYFFMTHAKDKPSELEIRRAIEGNLCMCTGYTNVVRAIKTLFENRGKPRNLGSGESHI